MSFYNFYIIKSFYQIVLQRIKKIGLGYKEGSLLSENRDIVVNFPYKDCILEGGQTKEDVKRDEIFFNETLAPKEITRLLDDKVFTNFKRYNKDGEHEVREIKEDDNFIIKGNNLVVLHSLKKRYAEKVKCIYIEKKIKDWIHKPTLNTTQSA